MPDDEVRCPTCRALVSPDAAWCGQCFASLGSEEVADGRAVPEATNEQVGGPTTTAPYWPCTVCGGRNPLDADTCVTCGTPFAAVMRLQEEHPDVTPKEALTASLLFPGLGHRKAGRPTDGFARGVLFVVSFGMALLVGIGGGVRSPATVAVFLLLLVTGLVDYAFSAYEAYRLAEGGDLLISSRILLWVLVGVVMLAVALLGLAVVTSTRR